MDLVKLFTMKFKNILLKLIESPFLQTLSYYFFIVYGDKLASPVILFWIIAAIFNTSLHKLIALFFIFCPLPLFFKYSLKIKILPKMIFNGFMPFIYKKLVLTELFRGKYQTATLQTKYLATPLLICEYQ